MLGAEHLMAPNPRSIRERLNAEPSMRRSMFLTAAFAGLMVVISALAIAVWRNATDTQARVAALHNAHFEAGNALASLRANVYLTGILTRDYLFDIDPGHPRQYIAQFADIRIATTDSFRTLAASTQNDVESSALDHLRREVDAYLDTTRIALDWTPEEKTARRAEFLSRRMRSREEIVALASQMERMMGDSFSRERARITSADREFRSSFAWTTGIALLFALGIAGIAMARIMTLERRSQVTESELRRMSSQVRTAQEHERRYLSRELHDQVGQMLTGLRMELANIASVHKDSDNNELTSRIAHAKSIVEQTLRLVRNIAMLLRPSMLDDLGLTPALAWLVKEISRSSGIEIEADMDPVLDLLPDSHRTCLYRVVQEALTNVSKHAGAHKVDVSLKVTGGWVVGTIADNGCGFDAAAIQRDGLGLVGMEERVRELGGHVRVISTLGRGTRVEFRLPVPRAEESTAAEEINDSSPDFGRSRNRTNRVETST
jgi:signal transduction histidine kinase